MRTRAVRARLEGMSGALRKKPKGQLPEDLDAPIHQYLKAPDDNGLKVQMARLIVDAPEQFGHHFMSKSWVLLRTSKKRPYLCGDHPLILQNMTDMGPYGNLGLAVTGIEIYFPLSKVRALAMWCPSIAAQVLDGAAIRRRLRETMPSAVQSLHHPTDLERLAKEMVAPFTAGVRGA